MKDIIKSLNLNVGEVLTLEKLQERMEFEAFGAGASQNNGIDNIVCAVYSDCVLNDPCPIFFGCACDAPEISYTVCIPDICELVGGGDLCRPYKGAAAQ